jgi:DNA polymerase-3 subunit delta'
LQYDLALSPHEGQWRVCIISDFQTATVEAENALLKTLEEPPSRAVIILTATDASLLLPTIVSRCQVLPLRVAPTEQIARVLIERFDGPEDRARLVARLSAGRVGWALEAMKDDSLLEQRRQRIKELLELVQGGQAARILAAERLSKLAGVSDIVRLWQGWWRDLVLACSGCEELITNQDFLETLRQLAGLYDLAEAEAAVRGAGEALQRFDQNVNTRLALEALLLSWRRVSLA